MFKHIDPTSFRTFTGWAILIFHLIGLGQPTLSFAQSDVPTKRTVRFVVVPEANDIDGDLYLAGNHALLGGWKPDGVRLVKQPDGSHAIKLAFDAGTSLEFKVTRGSWATVEKNKQGKDVPNRRLWVNDDTDAQDTNKEQTQPALVCTIEVEGWGQAVAPKSSVVGTLNLIDEKAVGEFQLDRRIGIWLPPGYDQSTDRYPVLYLHDGQNLFDGSTAAFGVEWQVDETATRLIEANKIEPLIIVGIWNTPARIREYGPQLNDAEVDDNEENENADRETRNKNRSASELAAGANDDSKGPTKNEAANDTANEADRYLKFLVTTVKPLVDKHYRTRPEREFTAIGGSSLGGLISIYACCEYPETFSQCAAISPSLWWNNEQLLKSLEGRPERVSRLNQTRFWIDMGDLEGSTAAIQRANVERVRRLAEVLKKHPQRTESDLHLLEVKDGQHNEASWAQRFGNVLEFLFK